MKDRIKKIMEMQRTTQQDFADQLKIAPATLRRNKKSLPSDLYRLAHVRQGRHAREA